MPYQSSVPPSSRLGGVIFVGILHLGLIYFLATSLNINVQKIREVLKVDIVTESSKEEAPPPPPPAMEKPPPDYIPPPEIDFAPSESTGSAITSVTNTASVPPKSPKGGNARPDYPEASVRLGEEGSAIVAVYVNEKGQVTDAKIEKTTGFPRLDEAAQKGAMRFRFIPGTQGGKPAAMWHRVKISFRICEEKQIKCSS